MDKECSHFSLNTDGTTKCQILHQIGIIALAPPSSPNFPCERCKEGWGESEPTLDNPTPILLQYMEGNFQTVGQGITSPVVNSDPDTVQNRLIICERCEFKQGPKCAACGCSIKSKVNNLKGKCPIGKW